MNVMWVVAQVLGHEDPSFDVLEFAGACGLDAKKDKGWIQAGVRTDVSRYGLPGTYQPATAAAITCHVCGAYIEPDKDGQIRRESITDEAGRVVWGPVCVHTECRTGVTTRYDGKEGYTMTWDHITVPSDLLG